MVCIDFVIFVHRSLQNLWRIFDFVTVRDCIVLCKTCGASQFLNMEKEVVLRGTSREMETETNDCNRLRSHFFF